MDAVTPTRLQHESGTEKPDIVHHEEAGYKETTHEVAERGHAATDQYVIV